MPGGSFYRSKAWLGVRASALKRDAYRCATPRCTNRANTVDHIKPMSQGGAGLDLRNLMSRCKQCHDRITARFDGGFGNPKRERREFGCDADGWPLDEAHPWRKPGG
jgi:5-methylcytosine-specific restriction protein A